MATSNTIDHSTLSHLVDAGAVRAAHAVGQAGGWAVVVKCGTKESALAATKSKQVRLFKKLDKLVEYLMGLGISHFDVDTGNYDPGSLKTYTRPDRSAALKQAHEAAAYDTWFRSKVQESLDDPRPAISHEQVKAEWEAERAELLARAGKGRA